MNWGEVIAEHADRIATIETRAERQALRRDARAGARSPDWLYYFGGLADKIEGTVIPLDRQSIFNYTLREPLGVVGVITPWNSPTFIAIMSLAPALAAGNTDRAEAVGDHLGIGDRAGAAGRAGRHPARRHQRRHRLPRDRRSAGRSSAGRARSRSPAASAPAARSPRAPGSGWSAACSSSAARAPNIVFDDANLDQAEAGVLAGIFAAAGQTCVAGSRAYIQRVDLRRASSIASSTRAQQITHRRSDEARTTQMGPVATKMQLEKDESMVQRAVSEGAAGAVRRRAAAARRVPGRLLLPADDRAPGCRRTTS